MRCGQSLQKRYIPGVGRSKIQPGRPRIREVLVRSVTPVTAQPDDKRAGGSDVDCFYYWSERNNVVVLFGTQSRRPK